MNSDFPYIFKKKLGAGGFGAVYRVEHKKTHKYYACKVIKKGNDEMGFLLKLKGHPNVVECHESYKFNNKRLIIMEECTGPNILEYLMKEGNKHKRKELQEDILVQCIDAIKHCHDNGIIHRDIKHTNFIMNTRNRRRPVVKLIDFGLSEYDFGYIPTQTAGTLRYIPPEAFLLEPVNNFQSNIQTKSYDIWSLAIMIFVLYAGEDMFYADDEKTIVRYIRTRKINNSMRKINNVTLNRLLYKMFSLSPFMRPEIDEVRDIYLDVISPP